MWARGIPYNEGAKKELSKLQLHVSLDFLEKHSNY